MSVMSVSQIAFEIASASIAPNSDFIFDQVNMDPDHSGMLRYAILMGARIHILDQRWEKGIPISKLRIQPAKKLNAVTVRPDHLSTLIQDLPALAMMAVCADGTTVIRGVNDETPHLDALCQVLRKGGAQIEYNEGSLSIPGMNQQGQTLAKAIYSRFKEVSS